MTNTVTEVVTMSHEAAIDGQGISNAAIAALLLEMLGTDTEEGAIHPDSDYGRRIQVAISVLCPPPTNVRNFRKMEGSGICGDVSSPNPIPTNSGGLLAELQSAAEAGGKGEYKPALTPASVAVDEAFALRFLGKWYEYPAKPFGAYDIRRFNESYAAALAPRVEEEVDSRMAAMDEHGMADWCRTKPRTRELTTAAEVRQALEEGLRVEFSRQGNVWHDWAWSSEDYAEWFELGHRARAVLP